MKTTYLLIYIFLLAISFNSYSQTSMCGDNVPEGWVTTEITGMCPNGAGVQRYITDIRFVAPGYEITICGDLPPAGWVTKSVNGNCGYNSAYISRTIKKVEGYTAENTMTICDSPAPSGWVTTSINGNCGFDGSYLSRTIKRIADLPTGTVFSDFVCGDPAPEGWITTNVNGNCGYNGSYIARTIKKIAGMAPGAEEDVCGDLPPAGWTTLTVNSNCGYNSSYLYRRIKKLEGLPSGTEVNICGDLPPANWVTLSVNGNCGLNSAYVARKIQNVICMPVGTSLTICGDNTYPNGWILKSENGYCSYPYLSRTIEKISGYPTNPPISISGPSNTTICSGESVTLSASNCPSGTITWSTGAGGPSITVYPTTTTNYTATCTQGECTSTSNTITITVTTVDVQVSPNASACAGKSATLTASGCSLNYQWFTSQTSTTPIAYSSSYTTPPLNNQTIYYVNCKNGNCESAKKSITVNITAAPNQPTANGQTICAGKSATLTATGCSGGTYKWYSSASSTAVLASTASYTTPTLNSNTTYYVSCTINCESTRRSVSVTIGPSPSAPTASASGTAICNGQSVTLTATGCAGTVTWSNGASGSSISVGTTGTYAAKCTINGCVSANSNVLTITSGNSNAPDNLILSGNATAGVRTANKTITSTQTIPNGVNTTYNAGNNITLNPPFKTNTGSIFKVEIKGCGS
ncbi:immunoglobulin domain-containing protein [Emticicia agri]|uniref:Ig-like domain-containing protein n=1 Tax=Emticicia agri TaxID=2492393 RepID=A0A4Q5M3T7_9BACT|nr:3-coathanger stack domain-containing protein [Emticicia agri]RYU96759.1 hypothetical protein EWM59_04280 [Emticicia agri]